jgi:sRNA-binding regulator protein Hfq
MNFKDLKGKKVILFLSGGFNLSGSILEADKKTMTIRTVDGDDFLVFKNKVLAINFTSSVKKKSPKETDPVGSVEHTERDPEASSFLNENVFVVRSKNKNQNNPVENQIHEEEDKYIPIDLTNMRKPEKISGDYDQDFSISLASLQSVPSQARPENKK